MRIGYDRETGKIKGYYPENITYSSIPFDVISASKESYLNVLGNENKYRIRCMELICIENTAEYFQELKEELRSKIVFQINRDAKFALKHGIIKVDENHYVNAEWLDYYNCMLKFSESADTSLRLKTYISGPNQKIYCRFEEFKKDDAQKFMNNAIESISLYQNQHIPAKMNDYLQTWEEISQTNDVSKISGFGSSINYGLCIDENTNPTDLWKE